MEAEPQPRRRFSTLLILLIFVAFCAVAVVVAVALTGADDDEDGSGAIAEPTADSYVEQLATLGNTLNERVGELQTQFSEQIAAAGDDESARVNIAQDNFTDIVEARREFIEGVAEVSPPTEVADAHAEVVAAGENYLAALEEAVDNIEDVTTFDDAQAIILDPALEERHSEFASECSALVAAVREHGTEIVIFC